MPKNKNVAWGPTGNKVLIWSFEHDAWWAPNERGYTQQRKRAGIYDRSRAEEICVQANIARPADSPHEEIRELTMDFRDKPDPQNGDEVPTDSMPTDEQIAAVVRRMRVYEREIREAKQSFERTAGRHRDALEPLRHALGLAELALEELLEQEDETV